MEEQQKLTGSPLNLVMIQKNLNSDLKTYGSGDDGCSEHLRKFFLMRNDLNARSTQERNPIKYPNQVLTTSDNSANSGGG